MRERILIYGGLLLFLAAVTWPAWRNAGARAPSGGPKLKMPAAEKQCVAPRDFMRRSHMDLLIEWREAVVRTGARTWRASDGRSFEMSLSKTCLRQCHTEKSEFCDRCHTYALVKEKCWQCHVDPQPAPVVALAGRRGE